VRWQWLTATIKWNLRKHIHCTPPKINNFLPVDTVQHTGRLESSTLMWETQISHCLKYPVLESDNRGESPGSITGNFSHHM
jgi:hypothetical protein